MWNPFLEKWNCFLYNDDASLVICRRLLSLPLSLTRSVYSIRPTTHGLHIPSSVHHPCCMIIVYYLHAYWLPICEMWVVLVETGECLCCSWLEMIDKISADYCCSVNERMDGLTFDPTTNCRVSFCTGGFSPSLSVVTDTIKGELSHWHEKNLKDPYRSHNNSGELQSNERRKQWMVSWIRDGERCFAKGRKDRIFCFVCLYYYVPNLLAFGSLVQQLSLPSFIVGYLNHFALNLVSIHVI